MERIKSGEGGYARFEIDGVPYRIKPKFLPKALNAVNIQQIVENAVKHGAACWWDNDKQEASIE